MADDQPFWMVLADNSSHTAYRHASHGSAVTEAKRLAAQNKGVKFFVLASVGHAVVRDPVEWTAYDIEIPF
jgi:hypothetical protein